MCGWHARAALREVFGESLTLNCYFSFRAWCVADDFARERLPKSGVFNAGFSNYWGLCPAKSSALKPPLLGQQSVCGDTRKLRSKGRCQPLTWPP